MRPRTQCNVGTRAPRHMIPQILTKVIVFGFRVSLDELWFLLSLFGADRCGQPQDLLPLLSLWFLSHRSGAESLRGGGKLMLSVCSYDSRVVASGPSSSPPATLAPRRSAAALSHFRSSALP